MARRVYDFEEPDRFVAGAIGVPGDRTFYLQACEGSRVVSVLIEKVQVELLANRLQLLLVEVRARGASVPDDPADADLDTAPMDEPLNEVFRVGTLAIIWDGDDDSVVVEARQVTAEDEEDSPDEEAEIDNAQEDSDTDVMRVHMQPGRALAFAKQALKIVAAGRPPCPFCGQPLNPEGHICARRNGFMH